MSTTPNFSVRLALVRLTGPTGIAFEWEEDQGHPSSWPSSPFLGVLGPGEYELEVIIAAFRATATGSFGSSSASASFAMSIPSVGGASLAAASLLALRRRPRRPSLVHKTGRVLQSVFLLAVLVGAVGLPATRAAADIVYLTQDRDIEASAFVDGQPQGGGLNAPDFADWDRSITRTFPGQNRIATASQNSRLLSDAILFTGAGSVSFGQPDVPVVEGRAASTLDVRFRLDSEMPFRIDHAHTSMSTSPNFSGRLARARLTGRAGLIFEWSESQDLPNTWPSTPYFGILMPGDYQVELTVSATRSTPTGSFGASSASASFAMSIPSVGGAGLAGVSLLALRRRPRR